MVPSLRFACMCIRTQYIHASPDCKSDKILQRSPDFYTTRSQKDKSVSTAQSYTKPNQQYYTTTYFKLSQIYSSEYVLELYL